MNYDIETIFKGSFFHYKEKNLNDSKFDISFHYSYVSDKLKWLYDNIEAVNRYHIKYSSRIVLAPEVKKQIEDDYNRATKK